MIPQIENAPVDSSGDRENWAHSHRAEYEGLVFSTDDPVTVIIYSLLAIIILGLLYYIVQKIITQPVILEELNPLPYSSNTI
jgi:hypothetical protein